MIKVGGKEVKVLCNGATPLLYRRLLNRDIFLDLEKSETLTGDEAIILNFEIIENLFYVMAYQADRSIGTLEEFLSQFKPNDVTDSAEEILGAWIKNISTLEESKKN